MAMTLEEIIRSRRSVRRFTDQQVSREAILKLLDMARWAPCASQCWRFVVVQDPDGKRRLAEAAQQGWIAAASAVIVVGADTAAYTERQGLWYRWDAYKFRGLFYIQDTAAAIENLMLSATEMGLGTCWIGSFNEGRVAAAVSLPAAVRPVAMVPLGYPAAAPAEGSRRPLEEVVFWEKCGSAPHGCTRRSRSSSSP